MLTHAALALLLAASVGVADISGGTPEPPPAAGLTPGDGIGIMNIAGDDTDSASVSPTSARVETVVRRPPTAPPRDVPGGVSIPSSICSQVQGLFADFGLLGYCNRDVTLPLCCAPCVV